MPCFGQAKNLGQGEPFVAEAGKPLLVSFLCNHCPKTVPLRPAISVLFEEFGEAVSFVAVMSNDLTTLLPDGRAGGHGKGTEGVRMEFAIPDGRGPKRREGV